jgi:hypothetical protein
MMLATADFKIATAVQEGNSSTPPDLEKKRPTPKVGRFI